MAKTPRLKVFAAPIGFHDVYVAAPSRAAALRAWGSDRDLFSRGVAFEVTDPALAKEPLSVPGRVVRRLRGTEAEQFAALPADAPGKARARRSAPKAAGGPVPTAPPRPSRRQLDAAEAALAAAGARHREQEAEARARVEEAQRERHDLQRRIREEARGLAAERDAARDRYEAALERWRDGG